MYNGHKNQEAFYQALNEAIDNYAKEIDKAIANGTYDTGWSHANCDHANDYCEVTSG